MNQALDPYQVLGVGRDASADEIKNAYRRLARQYHPDVNPGDPKAESVFRRVSLAYDVLSDPDKRRDYDGERAGADARPAPRVWTRPSESGRRPTRLAQLLTGLFRRRRGQDLHTTVELPFVDAIRGTTATLTVHRPERCRRCSGASPGCPECDGRGRRLVAETMRVRVPPGVDEGDRVKVSGQGAAGTAGGPRGDLYVTAKVRPHELLRRDGADVRARVDLAVWEASLGTELEVPTVDGPAVIRIPPGTQTGQRFRLRGKGVPTRPSAAGDSRGDQLVEVRVLAPDAGDERVRKLLGELRDLSGRPPRFRDDREER